MTTELTTVKGGKTYEVTARDYAGKWTEKDVQFFREKFAKNSTPEEFKHFLDICSKYDLDPRVGHIYCQKYPDRKNGGWSPAAIIIGYHGLLHVANRDNYLDGIESQCQLDDKGNLLSATATVWKKGCNHPFKSEVDLSEYAGTSPFWRDKPKTMLKKVAEAHALRKAFNLSGLYLKEEIDLEQPTEQELPVTAPRQTWLDTATGEVVELKPAPKLAQLPNHIPADVQTERYRFSREIHGRAGVQTYGGDGWKPLTNNQFEQAAFTMTGMAIEELKRKLDINSFADAVKGLYPDAKGSCQRSAALHFIWDGICEQQVTTLMGTNDPAGETDTESNLANETAEVEPF